MSDFNTGDYHRDRAAACAWAHDLMQRDNWLILDTETTALRGARIVQIGLLAPDGKVVLDSLVNPRVPIPAAVTAIHGLCDDDVADAPTLPDLLTVLAGWMQRRETVIYNKGFDTGALHNHIRATLSDMVADSFLAACRCTCAMMPYSAFVGEWNDYHGNYKWQRLPDGDHTAIGDCRATLEVIKAMAAQHQPEGDAP